MLMFPKQPKKKKKRIRHPASIMHQEPGTCYLCVRLHKDYQYHSYLEEHHAYDGKPNRTISEENGLKVKLCVSHHREGPEAVHNNAENMRLIQKDVQREYEKTHTRQQFIDLIGRNYIMEDNDGES